MSLLSGLLYTWTGRPKCGGCSQDQASNWNQGTPDTVKEPHEIFGVHHGHLRQDFHLNAAVNKTPIWRGASWIYGIYGIYGRAQACSKPLAKQCLQQPKDLDELLRPVTERVPGSYAARVFAHKASLAKAFSKSERLSSPSPSCAFPCCSDHDCYA